MLWIRLAEMAWHTGWTRERGRAVRPRRPVHPVAAPGQTSGRSVSSSAGPSLRFEVPPLRTVVSRGVKTLRPDCLGPRTVSRALIPSTDWRSWRTLRRYEGIRGIAPSRPPSQ